MSVARRTSSRLTARASPYSSGVTLFKLEENPSALPDTPQRHRRVKIEPDALEPEMPLLKMEDDDSVKLEPDPLEPGASSSPSKNLKSRRSSKSPQKTKTVRKKALETPHPAPARWREVYDAIKEMRAKTPAPVDTMGCQMAQRHETDPKNKRLITLVSLMLSPQTKDQITDAAVIKLRTALGGTMSLEALLAADFTLISEAINKVGMWRGKTKYLMAAAEKLRDDFNGDVPDTIEGLLTLPGVGPKVGFLVLQSAWNINDGIGVDVHVLRITRLLGWHKAETPEDARISLESWLPKELHREINPLLVGFGQTTCVSNNPRCGECTLSVSGLCPSANIKTSTKKKKPVPEW